MLCKMINAGSSFALPVSCACPAPCLKSLMLQLRVFALEPHPIRSIRIAACSPHAIRGFVPFIGLTNWPADVSFPSGTALRAGVHRGDGCPGTGGQERTHGVRRIRCGLLSKWVWIKIKPPGHRRSQSLVPFARVPKMGAYF